MGLPYGGNLNLAAERAYPTPLANSTLLPLLLLSLARQKHSPDTAKSIREEYDYVIVGAGTAGSVVAARLSEVPCVSVLLLEAGGPPPRLNEVPAFGRNYWLTDVDWQYLTAPQKNTGRLLRNSQVSWPGGKALGGSSILNDGLHVRGNRKDYDDWAAMGAKGWSYEEVLPYFKKLEDNRDPDYVANGYHGLGGPVTVMRASYNPEIKQGVFHAAQAMGYKIVDSNARTQIGFYDPQVNLRDNQRCSTAKAYLVPAENRTNLDILPKAMVEKILIRKRKAAGVQFAFNGRIYKVKAKREVIMSAGAVNTAQILMLSGIGPRKELQKFNIPVHADLPVGQNFHDHGGTTVDFTLSPYIAPFAEKLTDPANIKRYVQDRSGPLASPEGVSNMAFLYNDEVNSRRDYPNYELFFGEGGTMIPEQQWNLKPEVYRKVYRPYENHTIFMCFVQQLQPRSRGSVTLRSTDPYDDPVIDPNYLEDPRDLEDFVQGMKTCRRIGNSPQMRKLGSRPFETLYPGCERYAHDEDLYFRCQTRSVLFTQSHPVGTAKMGDPRDPSTVVDPKLRVKNIKGLRVVDNSIIPKIVSGNTGVPAIMIGEKAADIIKESIRCHDSENHHDVPTYYDGPEEEPSSIESEDFEYDEADQPNYQENDYNNDDKDYGYDDITGNRNNFHYKKSTINAPPFQQKHHKDYDEEYDQPDVSQGKGDQNQEYDFPGKESEYDYIGTNQGKSGKSNDKTLLFPTSALNYNFDSLSIHPPVASYERDEYDDRKSKISPTRIFEGYEGASMPKRYEGARDGVKTNLNMASKQNDFPGKRTKAYDFPGKESEYDYIGTNQEENGNSNGKSFLFSTSDLKYNPDSLSDHPLEIPYEKSEYDNSKSNISPTPMFEGYKDIWEPKRFEYSTDGVKANINMDSVPNWYSRNMNENQENQYHS